MTGRPQAGTTNSTEARAPLWPWGAALLSGLLLAACFPPWNQEWLCWVALTPLISAVWFSRSSGKRAWLRNIGLGYCAGLAFFWAVFRWLTTVTGPGWFALAFFLALYFAFWGWILGLLSASPDRLLQSRYNLWLAFIGASAWTAEEWARGVIFSGFGWNGLGVALCREIPLIQITDVTGVLGLSFMVAFCNIIAALTIRRFALEIKNGKLRPHFDFTLAMVGVVLVFLYGVRKLQQQESDIPLRLAAVQANIPQDEKFNEDAEQKVFDRFTELSRIALASRPQLLIWPESSTPRGIFSDQVNFDFVSGIAKMGNFDFLLGSVDFEQDGDYNAAFLLTNQAKDYQTYRKIHLVPFGEFIPFRNSFPLFAKIAGSKVPGDFNAGKEYTVMHTTSVPEIKLATLICFEDSIGDLTRHFVLNGAQLLVNITNDGWFLKSEGSDQHLANCLFRAVETRRPLVRCANTGVTCFIDTRGRIKQILSPKGNHFIEGVLAGVVQVPTDASLTFYTKHGDLIAYFCLGVVALFLLGTVWTGRQRSER